MLQKKDFKIWKPWTDEDEKNIPKWAGELMEADLKTVLTKDSQAGEDGLAKSEAFWKKVSFYMAP